MRSFLFGLSLLSALSLADPAAAARSYVSMQPLNCIREWTAVCQLGVPSWTVEDASVEVVGVLGEVESRYRIVGRKENTLELLEQTRDAAGGWVDGKRRAAMRLEGDSATYWGQCGRSLVAEDKSCAAQRPIELVSLEVFERRQRELEAALAPDGKCPGGKPKPPRLQGPCLNPPADEKWRDGPTAEICLTPLEKREILGPRKSGVGDFSVRLDNGPWTPLPKDQPVPFPVPRTGRHRLQIRQGTTPLESLPLRFTPGSPRWLTLSRNGYGFFALEPRSRECVATAAAASDTGTAGH